MDLNEIAVFVKVVEAGSFSGAARLLGLPTSTVSTRISRLEKRLGMTLLQRTTRRLQLTEVGEQYYRLSAVGIAHLLDAESAIAETAGEPQGRLRVTAPADIGDDLLADIIDAMRQHYPKVSIDMVLSSHAVDLIGEGIDVAIRAGELKDSTLIAKKVGTSCWAPFASRDYLQSAPALAKPQDLSQHRCLQFTPLGKESWILNDKRNRLTIPMPGEVMVNDIGVIRRMALAGEGVALLPLFLCKKESDDGAMVRVLPDWYARANPIHLIYPRQRFMPPKLRAFIDLASTVIQQWME